jgi:hypothetical protein
MVFLPDLFILHLNLGQPLPEYCHAENENRSYKFHYKDD